MRFPLCFWLLFWLAVAIVRLPANPSLQIGGTCLPDHADDRLRCTCVLQHPEWCSVDEPPPSCCRVTEKGTAAKRCGCCEAR